jgi:mRNA interferase MazF
MPYRFGDVIVVPFPFTDQTATKKRPAVVISSEAYQRERPDLILMAITSQLRPAPTVGEVPSVIRPLITVIREPGGELGPSSSSAVRTSAR